VAIAQPHARGQQQKLARNFMSKVYRFSGRNCSELSVRIPLANSCQALLRPIHACQIVMVVPVASARRGHHYGQRKVKYMLRIQRTSNPSVINMIARSLRCTSQIGASSAS